MSVQNRHATLRDAGVFPRRRWWPGGLRYADLRRRLPASLSPRHWTYETWGVVLIGVAALLCVWAVQVGLITQARVQVRHWDASWVGLDLAEAASLVMLGILLLRRSRAVSIVAAIGATLLVVDAWFDVLTSQPGHAHVIALAMALLVELPGAIALGVLSWRAYRW